MKNKFLRGMVLITTTVALSGCGVCEKWAKSHGWIDTGKLDVATNASEELATSDKQLSQDQIKELSLDMLRGFPESFTMKLAGDATPTIYYPGTDSDNYPGTWNHTAIKLEKEVAGDKTTVNEIVVFDFDDTSKYYTYNEQTKEVAECLSTTENALTGWEVYEKVTKFSYREMYQIATAYLNSKGKVETGLSSVEFMIDPETMIAYGYSEPGTEKVEHLKRNSDTSLVYIKQISEQEYDARGYNYWNSYGVQINGDGKLYTQVDNKTLFTDNPELLEFAKDYMISMRGRKYWETQALIQNTTADALVENMVKGMGTGYWIKIEPKNYVVTALWNRYLKSPSGDVAIANWSNSSFRIQAKWAEILYNKNDRQVWNAQ